MSPAGGGGGSRAAGVGRGGKPHGKVGRANLSPLGGCGYFGFVQRITGAVQAGLGADGSFVAMNNIVSQSVPHLHCHVVPRRRKDGLRGFFWPRTRYSDGTEAAAVAEQVRAALSRT